MVLSSINGVTIAKGQSSPTGVGEERVLAPICCMAVVVRMVVVAMLLGVVFSCGKWMRWMVDGGVCRIDVIGRQWKSGVLRRSGEKKVTLWLVSMHYCAHCPCIFKEARSI